MAIVYVNSITGHSKAPGTAARPLRDLAHAIAVAGPGGAVEACGTFGGQTVHVPRLTLVGNDATIRAADSAQPMRKNRINREIVHTSDGSCMNRLVTPQGGRGKKWGSMRARRHQSAVQPNRLRVTLPRGLARGRCSAAEAL